MKKKAMAIVMAAATAVSLMAGSLSVSAATEPDTSAEKTIKVLSIWAEDSADGKILTGILDNYIKDVNPNFSCLLRRCSVKRADSGRKGSKHFRRAQRNER